MTHHRLYVLAFGLPLLWSLNCLGQTEQDSLKQEAQSLVMQFAGTLKPQLLEAINVGGLEHAVEVCATQAPQIAAQLSQASGWSVRRVSLRTRNSALATPDAFEHAILEQFEQRQKQGESADTMAYAETIAGEYRFMKAQGTEGLCLNCHGEVLNPELVQVLDRLYPDDQARGYALGQIRGAISLRKAL